MSKNPVFIFLCISIPRNLEKVRVTGWISVLSCILRRTQGIFVVLCF